MKQYLLLLSFVMFMGYDNVALCSNDETVLSNPVQGTFMTEVQNNNNGLDEKVRGKINHMCAEGQGYELNQLGDEFFEDKQYTIASAYYLASLEVNQNNHDLLCFLRKNGFDYKNQWYKPQHDDAQFIEFVSFLATKLQK